MAVRVIEDLLCDPSATEFLMDVAVKQICPALPVDRDQCEQISEALVPVAVQWLRASATPLEMCSTAGVCGSALEGQYAMSKTHAVSDSFECPLCQFVINAAKASLVDPSTQAQVKQAAEAACMQLPAEMVPGCKDMVDRYEALLVQMVEAEDTTQACAMMGLCAGTLTRTLAPLPLPLPLLHALHALRPRLPPSRPPMGGVMRMQEVQGDTCDYCQMAVLEAHSLLKDPTFRNTTIMYAKAMCTQAPSDWQAVCGQMVDAYAPLALQALERYMAHPDALCTQLHLCSAATPLPLGPGFGPLAHALHAVEHLLGGLWGWMSGQPAPLSPRPDHS